MLMEDYRKEGFTREDWINAMIGTTVLMTVLMMAG